MVGAHWQQLGFPYIEKQHQELLHLHTKIKESFNTYAADRENVIREALGFLADYVMLHFLNEERLMMGYRYDSDQYYAHIKEHLEFIEAVERYKQALRVMDQQSSEKLLVDLSYEIGRIVSHIQKTDQLLIDFLKKKGAHADHAN